MSRMYSQFVLFLPMKFGPFLRQTFDIWIFLLDMVLTIYVATLRRQFSLISINSIDSSDLLPDVIADDGPNATAGQALSKWLNTPSKDGKPKQLSCRDHSEPPNIKWINGFKEAFLSATTTSSASYIIRLAFFEPAANGSFELVNERTNEMLTLEKEENDDENMENEEDDDWLLKRCPIGETIQWEDENSINLNNVNFTFYNGTKTNCIGQLSPPKAGQKNAKNCLKMKPGPSSGERKKK